MLLWIPGAKGLVGEALAKESFLPTLATTHSEVDIADGSQVKRWIQEHPNITHIVNCAGYSLVDLSEVHREEAFRANALGPEVLSRAAKTLGARFLHLSTDYVFEGKMRRLLSEEEETGPCNYYGQTKLEGEKRVFNTYPEACVVRISWVFGRGGKNFVAKLFQQLKEKVEISLVDDQWGRPTYVVDLVQVLLQMLDKSGLYHFANAGIATKFSFGSAMWEEARKLSFPLVTQKIYPVSSKSFPSPCLRPTYSAFDTAKIERELSLSIRSWQEALRDYLCTLRFAPSLAFS